MSRETSWREFLRRWPADVPRRGVVVTAFAEQIPFDSFALSESLALFNRRTPDTSGARKVILPYDQMDAIKIVDVVAPNAFAAAGLGDPTAGRPPAPAAAEQASALAAGD